MKLEDVKVLTQQMVAQALGRKYMEQNDYLTTIPTSKLVDIGKDITDAENTVEKATKALCVLLAKREVDEGRFSPLFADIIVDRVEWGGFIERDKIDFADIMDSPVFNIEDKKNYSDVEHTYYAPKVQSKIYDEGKAIMIPISIQRETLTEAFYSWDKMNAFISKIRSKVQQTLKLAIDRYCNALVNGAIVVSAKATKTAVYLLDDALAEGVNGITAETTPEQALANKDFILFVAKKIAEVRDNMKVPTTAYNNGSWAVASEENTLYLLSNYTRNLKFDVKSGLFNKEDVGFGDFKTIPSWQGYKTIIGNPDDGKFSKFAFNTSSRIMMSADPTNKLGVGTSLIDLENVLGVLFDKKALGLTVFKEYTTTSYTASADFWNEFIHSLTNQILDSDYPIVAFLVDRKPTT